MHRCPHSLRTMRLPRTSLQARVSSAGVTRLCTSDEGMHAAYVYIGSGTPGLEISSDGPPWRLLDRSTTQEFCSCVWTCASLIGYLSAMWNFYMLLHHSQVPYAPDL